MRLFGVLNASPDSLNEDSIVRNGDDARRRADQLLAEGVWGFDLGGQGSTFAATQSTFDEEWARLAPVLPVLAELGRPISIDTWRPEIARRALDAGATFTLDEAAAALRYVADGRAIGKVVLTI